MKRNIILCEKRYKIKMSQGVRASIAFFVASVISAGIGYITTPIYTTILTPAEYGEATLYFTWKQLIGIIAMYCLSYGVFNNGLHEYRDRRDEYVFSMLVLSNLITIIVSFILYIFNPLYTKYLDIDNRFIFLMCIGFLVNPAFMFWVVRQRFEYKYKSTFCWSVVVATVSPLISVVLLKYTDVQKLDARIMGAEIPLFIIYLGFYVYIAKKSGFHCEISFWKNALLFNTPLIPHYLSSYVLGSSDKIMISNMINSEATAYYSVAYTVASVALIVWSAANASLLPFTYDKCEKKDYQAIRNITTPIIVFFAFICICVMLLAPEVLKLMATDEYIDGVYVIPAVIGGVFFQVLYYLFANIIYYYKKTKYVMYSSVTAAFINIILNYIFIHLYGYKAAGYTTLVCYMIQAFFDYYAMRKALKEKPYDMKVILVLSVLLVVLSVGGLYLYSTFVLRYILLVIIVIVFLLKKDYYFSLYKSIKNR